MISNTINEDVEFSDYKFDVQIVKDIADKFASYDLGIKPESKEILVTERKRRKQTRRLLDKLNHALVECQYKDWLEKRGIIGDYAYSLNYNVLNLQDMLDLYVIPQDHILDEFGFKPIEGPVFADWRDGRLAGICIRNIDKDLDYAAAEKYTTSNYGWYLNGYDKYSPDDEIFIVEGVFDAINMRQQGFNAIAIGGAVPSPFQLGCLFYKFNNLSTCLDNDFWGHVGSYLVTETTGLKAFRTLKKDPGCYMDSPIEIIEASFDELPQMIQKYNKLSNRTRNLPYN